MRNIDDNVFDSRDVEERIKELELFEKDEDFDQEDKDELEKLRAFKDEVNSSEWDFGLTFISENYFEEYAQEFAEDIGAISKDSQWPLNHIDWEAAARELKMDYSTVEYDNETYYYRS
jgi:hypothetical protein